jgi:Spy/CpxP family protein refolding chaperone
MSLKSRFFTIFTAAAATAAFATFTIAQESPAPAPEKKAEKRMKGEGKKMGGKGHLGMHGKMGGKRGHMMGGLRGIELSDGQKEQIKAIREANKPTDFNREEMMTLGKAKRAGTITPEQEARLTTIREAGKVRAQNIHAQVQAVLTPEQKAQIEQRKNEMKQKREEFRQNREQRRQARPAVTTNDTF